MSEKLLEIKDEKLSFFTPAGEVKALNGVSFSMNEGEVLGMAVGASEAEPDAQGARRQGAPCPTSSAPRCPSSPR